MDTSAPPFASIGIDIGKEVFHIVGFSAEGKIAFRRKIKRLALTETFEKFPPCVVGMEACLSAHFVSRALRRAAGTLSAMPDVCLQGAQLFFGCAIYRTFDFSVAGHKRKAKGCKLRAATLVAAHPANDNVMLTDASDFIDEIPRMLVRHVHHPACSGDRTASVDCFKQAYLTRTDAVFRIEVNAYLQRWG
jgi:hypothetical protein